MSAPSVPSSEPAIYRLSIERLRGIKSLAWLPVKGVNLILGDADAGKTTIAAAMANLPVRHGESVFAPFEKSQ